MEHAPPYQPKPIKTITKFTGFLGCLGFSRKPIPFPEKKPAKKNRAGSHSCSWVCIKNSGAKTVPLDSTVPGSNPTSNASKSKRQKPSTNQETPRQTPVRDSSDREPKEMPGEETRYRSSEQDIILENGKLLDHVETTGDATCKKRLSFCRKIDAITTGTNQPGSPEVKVKPIRTVSITLSKSSPSQPDERSATTPNTAARSRVTIKKPHRENDHQNKKKSDHPLIGMSIIITTLVIMVVWGKLCAILCTSAWFYFVPRLRSEDTVSNGLISTESFYDSEEYKKRVVLDGFLERSRRSVS
ncbi:hypothetical protein SADUNF_Sadunf07G0059200 [Salix dunnii]|uniref:Uncharacterized protein n=1 Tax=Salix dunnii TaxID=1413687 RepID=A0A835K1H9_9ROSI|nr:hypothetical protein SADUNF_Sadunf07G0059200 [Salix dunnii]